MGAISGLRAALSPIRARIKRSLSNTRLRASLASRSVRIGANAQIKDASFADHVSLMNDVELNGVEFGPYANVAHHAQISSSVIGRRSSIGRYSKLRNVRMGSYCTISWDVTIGAVSHPMDHPSSHAFWYRKKFGLCDADIMLEHPEVTLGNDVWVGCGAIIMPGVAIGDGAVVGAGAVVTEDVEPYAIVAGVPAKTLRYRFDEKTRAALSELAWWDWSDEDIRAHEEFFSRPLESLDLGTEKDGE